MRLKAHWLLFGLHAAALVFGLAGILIALPHPELWADSKYGSDVFHFGLNYGGSIHILWGALAMLAFGGATIGWRRTGIFFLAAVPLSLGAELIGTSTGWPFGNYAYTDFLGYKILGHVPFTIPLSWFYVGFASFLLANNLIARFNVRARSAFTVLLGGYFLVVWDLVLDPAMAHKSLPIKFWNWSETGLYYGMPIKNFVGWAFTALAFMAVSRLIWRQDLQSHSYSPRFPYAIYLANIVFAACLSLSVGLWIPVLIATLLGVLPASLVLRARPAHARQAVSPAENIGYQGLRTISRALFSRKVNLEIEGQNRVPKQGPAILLCRHYHHLYDGYSLLTITERRMHFMVALDWVQSGTLRAVIERACRLIRWPIVLRPTGLERPDADSAYAASEVSSYLVRAIRDSVSLLRAGELLIIFPEAFPNIDPTFTPKTPEDRYLPFKPGFIRIVELAERDGKTRVPIIPIGFDYQASDVQGLDWYVTMRVGTPTFFSGEGRERMVQMLEEEVRELSQSGMPVAVSTARRASA